MNLDLILDNAKKGNQLNQSEITSLMDHAIELLNFIEQQTLNSIRQAEAMLQKQSLKAN